MSTWWIVYYPLFIVFLILYIQRKETEQYIAARSRRQKGDVEMQTLAQRFIGKDVLLSTVGSGSCDGVVREVVDNAVVLEKNGQQTVVNLDYVIRMREYPKNKKGKRKSVIAE